jgi:hypothetical protein
MGNQGSSLDAVVTAGRPYTIQDAIEYDLYRAIKHHVMHDEENNLQEDVILMEGKNFGAYDDSVQLEIGDLGCRSSEWISDTTVKCYLNPGFKSSMVTESLIRDLAGCAVCAPPSFLDGCKKGIRLVHLVRREFPLAAAGMEAW